MTFNKITATWGVKIGHCNLLWHQVAKGIKIDVKWPNWFYQANNQMVQATSSLAQLQPRPRESQASSLGVWPIVLLGLPFHTRNNCVQTSQHKSHTLKNCDVRILRMITVQWTPYSNMNLICFNRLMTSDTLQNAAAKCLLLSIRSNMCFPTI